jgi:site-specific recombinase XerC
MIERQNYKRIKKHLIYLEEVLQLSPLSVDRYWFCLRHLILWADDTKFQEIPSIRPTFPVYLNSIPGKDGKKGLSGEFQKKTLNASKRFLLWCKAEYPREMAKLSTTWIDTLRLVRQPKSSIENVFVSLDEIKKIISYPADDNDLALIRDQAAAAMLFLSGM